MNSLFENKYLLLMFSARYLIEIVIVKSDKHLKVKKPHDHLCKKNLISQSLEIISITSLLSEIPQTAIIMHM